MDNEQDTEQPEEVTLYTFMEKFKDEGGTILDLFEYLKEDDTPALDVKLLMLLWGWLTVDSLELLEYEYHSRPETRKFIKRVFKDLKTLIE